MLTFGVIHRAARKGQKVEVRGEGRHSKKTSLKQKQCRCSIHYFTGVKIF
jgi:hypothetical protein